MFEVGLLSAFAAGILSFISPCILPLVPVYISLMSAKATFKPGENIRFSDRLFLFINSLFFVAGFTIIFVALGSTATIIGRLLKNYSHITGWIGGALLIIFGLNYIGVFRIPFLNFEKKFNIPKSTKFNYLGSLLIGIIFAFGWVPCVGVILSGILILASRLETLAQGIFLLLAYSLGLGIPFIIFSIFISLFSRFFKKINKHMRVILIISGIFLIILGVVLITGTMTRAVGFLVKYLPFLSKFNI
ncbi:MAG: cytochrome c biogenesis protein CcdA [Actinobacteria bacterium]|nr:cytochrome c biogenesis protein CcdA [Actinomycetota bacterium]